MLDHTGRTSVAFGEKFVISSVMFVLESGPAQNTSWGAFAPKF